VLPPLENVSAKIPPHQREQIAALAGNRGLSAGLRDVITAGLLALKGDCALIAPIDELRELADRLARIQGRRTPAGAWWAPTSEALPNPKDLEPGGAVLVTPQAVALIADGALVIDMEAGQITGTLAGHEVNISIDLSELAGPAALLPASLAGLAAAGPGRRELGLGLAVERTADNLCRVTLQGIGARCSADIAQTFAAEVAGLVARSARASFDTRLQLEQALAEVQP
jgi:hypothetical protein